jgi:outer membrane protein OmpA-like peptidoglycan-associated protein
MRARLSVISTLLLAGLVVGGLPATAEAQLGKRLKDAVKRPAEDKAIQKATEAENQAIDDAIAGQGASNPQVRFGTRDGGVYTGKIEAKGPANGDFQNTVVHARIMADGKYTKVYINGVRVGNGPNADLGRSKKVQFWVPAYDETSENVTMIGPVRVAAGCKKLYDALAEKGRVATQGIYFHTGSDAIRQESVPTLKEIGTMLKDHPEFKLTIEGHTDNVGKPESNQALSERRAAAVRQ